MTTHQIGLRLGLRIAVLGAVLTTGLVWSGAAQAQIVTQTIDQSGIFNLVIGAGPAQFGYDNGELVTLGTGSRVVGLSLFGEIAPLANGYVVGLTLDGDNRYFTGIVYNDEVPNGDAVIGLAFEINGGGELYGYAVEQNYEILTVTYQEDGGSITVAPAGPAVPEPGSLALLATGGLAAACARRRRAA